MENCQYEQVVSNVGKQKNNLSWKPFCRQVIICSGIWTCYFLLGVCMGATTVLVPQIRKEANSTDAVTPEMASWIAATFGFAGIPWVPVLPLLSYYLGRRAPFRLICAAAFVGAFLFYFSTSVIQIIISEAFSSILGSGSVTVFILVLPEYTSPKYRGIFLAIKSASFNWGVWVSNAIGTFFHWKNIGIVQIACCCYIFVTALLWPESPYWLAMRGKYEDCRKAHHFLKGYNEDAMKELHSIISSQQNRASIIHSGEKNGLLKTMRSGTFWKPVLFVFLLLVFYYTTGKTVITIYAIDIVKQISKNEYMAYVTMLILDGITVISMYCGCVVAKIVSRKSLLLYTTSIGIAFLFVITIYLYLIRFSVIVENKYITITLLSGYSIAVSCGPLLLSTSICSELLPVNYRNTAAFVMSILDRILQGGFLKLSPQLFYYLGLHGAFLFFAVSTLLLLLFLNKHLPETKDKTLHEIQKLLAGTGHKDVL